MSETAPSGSRNELDELLDDLATHDRGYYVLIHRSGKPIAALLRIDSAEDIDELEDVLDVRAIEEAHEEGGEPVPYERVRKELGLE